MWICDLYLCVVVENTQEIHPVGGVRIPLREVVVVSVVHQEDEISAVDHRRIRWDSPVVGEVDIELCCDGLCIWWRCRIGEFEETSGVDFDIVEPIGVESLSGVPFREWPATDVPSAEKEDGPTVLYATDGVLLSVGPLFGGRGPCLDAVQSVHDGPSPLDEPGERFTHRLILVTPVHTWSREFATTSVSLIHRPICLSPPSCDFEQDTS